MTDVMIVALGKLEHDPVAIKGHEKRLEQLDDLLASLPEHGLNQSLRVRPWAGATAKGKGRGRKAAGAPEYGVIAGNRRLATLKRLRDTGGAILGVEVTDEWPVPVIVGHEDDASAYEITAAENVQRLALSPVEEYRAFARMAETKPPAEVAAHFGVTEKRVRQRLRLAALHPKVLEALEAGKIGVASAEAFAGEPDPEKQAAYLKTAKAWQLEPQYIKSGLAAKLTGADSPVAKLIGADAYTAAGGVVFHDEFGDGDYWISPEIVERLLAEHWAAQIEAWKAEGWSFVQTADEYDDAQNYSYAHTWSPEPAADDNGHTAQQRAALGVVYWPDGSTPPRVGMKPPGNRTEVSPPADNRTLEEPGYRVETFLQRALCDAIDEPLAGNADLALAVLFAHCHLHWRRNEYGGALDVSIGGHFETDEEPPPAHPAGDSFGSALAWARAQDRETVLRELAVIVGASVDVTTDDPDAAMLVAAATPAFGSHFDAKTYFNQHLSPKMLAAAFLEMGGDDAEKLTKGELAGRCVELAASTGWLPPQLRFAGYAGPGMIPVRGEGEEEDDEELGEGNDDDADAPDDQPATVAAE